MEKKRKNSKDQLEEIPKRRKLRRRIKWIAGLVLLLLLGLWSINTYLHQSRVLFQFDGISEKVAALTIDDGPSQHTAAILDALKANGAKATFFLITDNIAGHEDVVRRIVSEGHEIAHHMNTGEMTARHQAEEFKVEFDRAEEILLKYQQPIRWFRPGMGWYNKMMIDYIQSKGYRCVLGKLFPLDSTISSSEFSTWFIEHGIKPGEIIILHDGPQKGKLTSQTLENVLPVVKEKGYTITTLSELQNAVE